MEIQTPQHDGFLSGLWRNIPDWSWIGTLNILSTARTPSTTQLESVQSKGGETEVLLEKVGKNAHAGRTFCGIRRW